MSLPTGRASLTRKHVGILRPATVLRQFTLVNASPLTARWSTAFCRPRLIAHFDYCKAWTNGSRVAKGTAAERIATMQAETADERAQCEQALAHSDIL